MALRAMNAHRMRTFLTMLGIIIGIASVVSVVALGTGARQAILSNIASLGTTTIEVYPGSGFGDHGTGRATVRGQRHARRRQQGHRPARQPLGQRADAGRE
ncbi:hypothetical protein G6F24_017600 [Rhizopus arrhizus]|nr:hypothetical protein G6F24_017600 [Rhizopus arrhizus]